MLIQTRNDVWAAMYGNAFVSRCRVPLRVDVKGREKRAAKHFVAGWDESQRAGAEVLRLTLPAVS